MTKLVLVFALLVPLVSNSQANSDLALRPDSTSLRSWNLVSFELPQGKLEQLHNTKGEKLNLNVSNVVVNAETSTTKHVHVRGNTSSYFKRKSLNISLDKKVQFHSSTDTFGLKRFFAVCLNMDKNYIRNKISYDILSWQQVNVPSHCYANLEINGASEGIYMIFYPPDDFAEKKCNASLVIRRGAEEIMDKVYEKNISRDEAKVLKAKYKQLYGTTLKLEGLQLFEELSQHLDLEHYFSFLAFNHLFQNGDYADELYFMWDTENKKFDIIPWDLDDILRIAPHEGFAKRDPILGDKLIFSSEDRLDVAIAKDPYVYSQYLKTYSRFLDELTPDTLQKLLNNIYQEVYIYFQTNEVITQSKFDQYGATDLTNLQNDLSSIYENVNSRATILRNQIKAQLNQ